MATFVHARRRDGQLLFRVWNTVVDKYETGPLTRDQVLAYLTGELLIESEAKRTADEALGAVFGAFGGMGMRVTPVEAAHTRSEALERLARAAQNGTSSRMGDKDDLDGEWDTEKCDECGAFHHEFQQDSHGLCRWCGEPKDDEDAGHGPACTPTS